MKCSRAFTCIYAREAVDAAYTDNAQHVDQAEAQVEVEAEEEAGRKEIVKQYI